jgi:hypothetical protein
MNDTTIFVIWKADSDRGQQIPIGRLDYSNGEYTFHYLNGMERARSIQMLDLPDFPNLYHVYRSKVLFPFFGNRLFSPRRSDFPGFLDSIAIQGVGSPLLQLEVLGRSEGRRMIDRFRLFLKPKRVKNEFEIHCFTSGLGRRLSEEDLSTLPNLVKEGDRLTIRIESENHYDKNALVYFTESDHFMGYMPAHYASELQPLLRAGTPITTEVIRVNRLPLKSAPDILLVKITGQWPSDWHPFESADYAFLSESALVSAK